MYYNDFYKRILDLSCTDEDLKGKIDDIQYDVDNAFDKYYDISIICKAIDKFLDYQWLDSTFSSWAYHYMYIILQDSLNEKTDNTLKEVIQDYITDLLDSLTFFSYDYFNKENNPQDLKEYKELFINLDIVYNSLSSWTGYCTKCNEHSDNYSLLLVNHTTQQYIILSFCFDEDNCKDENVKNVDIKEHLNILIDLQKQGYKLLHFDEKWYYMDIDEV